MTMRSKAYALAMVVACACACVDSSPTQQAVRPAATPQAPKAAVTTRPSVPAADTVVLNDLLGVEATAKRLSAEIYTPEVSGWRRALGGSERASQIVKANENYQIVYEKELRRAAYKHGLSYEAALVIVERHRAGVPPSS